MEILSKSRCADIIVHRSGRIEISAFAARKTGIRNGDAINVARSNGKLYLYISCKADKMHGTYRGVCRPSRQGTGHMRAYSCNLAKAILPDGDSCARFSAAGNIFVKEYGRMLLIIKMSNIA